jgi:hypothetical protein
MKVLIVPLLGPWHLQYPAYNAVTLRDLVAAFTPDAVATTALQEGALADPAWQDTEEVALPLTLLPWISGQGLPLILAGLPHPDPEAASDFRRYASQYPALEARLQQVDAQLADFPELLAKPVNLRGLKQEVLPRLAGYQLALEEEFADGPATGWLRTRVTQMLELLLASPQLAGAERLVILAPLEQVPSLQELLQQSSLVQEPLPDSVPVSEAARERSLLDFAFRGEAPDPEALVRSLRELKGAEARFHEANVLVATGHAEQALALLETTSHGDFSLPYYLPGFLLARLGQLRDLLDRRDEALKAYRAVRALSYAPRDALAAALRGLEEPFAGEADAGPDG